MELEGGTSQENGSRSTSSDFTASQPLEAKETSPLLGTSSKPYRISLRSKIAFGFCPLSFFSSSVIFSFFYNAFLLEVAELDPFYAGNILIISQIWDGITDPVVGRLSDITETRWGRRRPWILMSTLPFVASYIAMWQTFDFSSQTAAFFYYLFTLLLYKTFYTCMTIPYASMVPDLAGSDYDEATVLTSFKFIASLVGGILVSFAQAVIIDAFDHANERVGYRHAALIIGGAFIFPPLVTFLGTRERFATAKRDFASPEIGFLKGIKITFKNRAFMMVTCVYLLSWICVSFVQNNLLLYVKYVLHEEPHFRYVLLTVQGSTILFLVVWNFFIRKIGKKMAYYLGMAVFTGVEVAIFFLQEGDLLWMYLLAFFAGVGVAVAFLIPWSMLPDVVEQDELHTDQRREGMYYALVVLLQKIGLALALAAANYVLGIVGYENPDEEKAHGESGEYQPDAVLLALRIMIGPLPAVLLVFSYIPMYFYPITRETLQEIQRQLHEKKAKTSQRNTSIEAAASEPVM